MTTATDPQGPFAASNDYNMINTIVKNLLLKVQTISIAQVKSCTNDGGLSPFGFVSLQVLVNLMNSGQPVPHGIIPNIPYLRIQGGANAIIMDPEDEDIGIVLFCSRDISAVKSTQAAANPSSYRTFDWADGIYLGGILNGVPSQYVQFNSDGINIVSPAQILLQALNISLQASQGIVVNAGTTIDLTATESISLAAPAVGVTGAFTANGTTIDADGNLKAAGTITDGSGVVLGTHHHLPGSYVAGSTPVTGDSGNPT